MITASSGFALGACPTRWNRPQAAAGTSMSTRPLMIATLLGASIGVPYVVSHKSAAPVATGANASGVANGSGWSWPMSGPAATVTGVTSVSPSSVAPLSQPPLAPQTLRSVQLHPVETVLRFDLTRD